MAGLNDAKDSEADMVFLRHFHPGLCTTCLGHPREVRLKNCSRCQLVSYCSKACQKADWPKHKPFCQVNAVVEGKNVFAEAMEEARSKADWIDFRNTLQITTSFSLNRPLEPHEREILWCPKVCEICRDSDVSKVFSCRACYSVFYCSEAHRVEDVEQHKIWCAKYLACVQCDSFGVSAKVSNLPFPIQIYKDYSELPETMTDLLKLEIGFPIAKGTEVASTLFNLLISERLTDPLTLLYALQNFYLGEEKRRINEVSELVIHVVGAESVRELVEMIRWEYLAHRLPLIKKLQVVFVGPTIFSNFDNNDPLPSDHCIADDQSLRCEECSKSDRKYVYEMCRMLYHEYITRDYYSKPDAIVSFNCGFHEYAGADNDTWPNSLVKMIGLPTVPLIFTSYTKSEAQKDLEVIKKLGCVNGVCPTRLNPYRSLRPVRDFCRDDNCQIFYLNQYLTSVNGLKI